MSVGRRKQMWYSERNRISTLYINGYTAKESAFVRWYQNIWK